MNLARHLLNNPGLIALCVQDELSELTTIGSKPSSIRLKRTFSQKDVEGRSIRFWRVIGPVNHPNYMSDLSYEGLKEWGII